ncbi:MAG TPA: nucleotidyltransferase family protein [Gammaproteobacteria bacterium]|nr:nucleotidyltransferase family protein [Gammaproteobacteria bacterium]
MKRTEALKRLRAHRDYLAKAFGVVDIAVFGSMARDDAAAGSDIDILVRFDGPATSKRYFGLQFYLEDLLDCSVDLVTDKALRPELRPYIEREAVHV